ncbi:hydroxyproline O-galactosyltransferase GALT5 isoform X2 [Aegilops tauschii subsp. strangulata]|uniref:Galectin domain-containing protein n=2 Tax=Aegilops tauschii subsp. strangulata TaxID=200361 RepID=A0A453H499_AEGTS|nr:hydroxyproline O-galactosyltransferase GALT5 isoform X2 [Aegilops tauschii subsp. strangulata]
MRRPRRPAAGLRPLLLLLPAAALLYAAALSLRYPGRPLGPTTVSVAVTAAEATGSDVARPRLPTPHGRGRRLDVSRIDVRALDAATPLHAAAARAFREGARLLRDALSPVSAATPSPSPAPPRCPTSVARPGDAPALALPCGLALGSHVTVVGRPRRVPGGGLAQFAVELRGAGDGDAATTILHLNPRLRGDWSGRPVVELNTRFRGQWGPALRCEGWRRSDEDSVDGLVTCEQWTWNTGGTLEELKSMLLRNRVAGQSSSGLIDWPYPFVEGELFALTISSGLEGYHVQVDGRHVASFPYRVGFDLEDVATVQATGDIEVESMFAGTLPAVHPNILQRNLELLAELKAPPPEEPVELFIGILSAGSHFTERMAVRRSWMSAVRNSSSTMARFFVALNGRREVNEDLKKEADFFRDIIIVPFVDSYDLVVLKTVAICEYAARVVSAKYVMKCDDDTFVRLDSVMAEIKKIPDDKSFYMGNMNYYHRPLREGKWAVSYEEWPRETYPTYADGAGYIVSSDIAGLVASEMEKGRLNLFKMEDVSVGMWVGQLNAGAGVEYVHGARFCQAGCADDYLTAHYQSPGQMLCLWEKLRQGRPQCCNAR